MNAQEAYHWLVEHHREISHLGAAQALLGWDLRTVIPPRGHRFRAQQIALLAKLTHERMTDPRLGERLSLAESSPLAAEPLAVQAVNIREWRRAYDRATKIPQRLAVALSQAAAEGESAWEKARPANDWKGFQPHLERILALKREEAGALGIGDEPYDALLDEFEPDERAARVGPILLQLREALVTLLDRIKGGSNRPDPSVLRGRYSREAQERFAREVLARLGYDWDAGRLDPSAHPFSTGIAPGDVRITTRYDETLFDSALFSCIHEAGHALYEQGLPEEHWGTPMGQAVSLGIHESQSRLWENLVGRSLPFWEHFYPQAQAHFAELRRLPLPVFYGAINAVSPSLIRTEADEVTYNLHILLRFELELGLMRGEIAVADLPEAWNAKMQAFFGLTPPDDAQGVMQDIHWSGGAIGYFPTYTLGNLYAAQLFARAGAELPDLEASIARGEFAPLLDWLRAKIYSQGCRYRPRALLQAATGEELNPAYLIDYLNRKYAVIYGFGGTA